MKSLNIQTLKYALIPTFIVMAFSIYPQLILWSVKGSQWQGSYVVNNYDEVAYSAYVNSLINDRPRKNDPFVGRDDSPEHPQKETLFSIQFVPAYTIAYVAKIFGLSASGAFVLLAFIIAIFSSLAIFWLVREVSGNEFLSSVSVLVVLCFGTAVAFQGELQHLILHNYLINFFPFLRRYQPGLAFPLFFIFCLTVWRAFNSEQIRKALTYSVISGIIFVLLVFSYFYLWTTAGAWLFCISLVWFIWQKDDRKKVFISAAIIGAFAIAALIPYFMMLANRETNMDDIQLLILSRMPDIFVLPEIIGIGIAISIFILAKMGKIKLDSNRVLFTLSLALTPLILFNQQVITGRSLQPVHYEIFIANYLILTALMLLISILPAFISGENGAIPGGFKRALLYIGLLAAGWGLIESMRATQRNAGYESLRDDSMAALKYIDIESKKTSYSAGANGRNYPTAHSVNLMVADFIPTVTSAHSLWNPHTSAAGGVNVAGNRELFYKYLYFSGFDEKDLEKALNERIFEVVFSLFGSERALPVLGTESKPITKQEEQDEVKKYTEFKQKFTRESAADPKLSFMIVPVRAEPNFANLDRWYKRDEGQVFGEFKVYKVELR